MKINFTAPTRNLLPISNNHYYQENFLFDLNPVQQDVNLYLLHSQWRQISACLNSFFSKSFWKPQFSFLSSQRNNPYSFNFSWQTFIWFSHLTHRKCYIFLLHSHTCSQHYGSGQSEVNESSPALEVHREFICSVSEGCA